MKIKMEDVNGRYCELEINKREGKLELYLDDHHDQVNAFFQNKEDIDLAIYELTKLRKEIYG